jgi:hypothetical protein
MMSLTIRKVFFVAFISFFLSACGDKDEAAAKVSLRLALAKQPDSSLVMVAQEIGYLRIISSRLGVSESSLGQNWSEVSMKVVVDQSLLLVLEGISVWAIQEKLSEAKEVTNFLEYIDQKALKQISPVSVNAI